RVSEPLVAILVLHLGAFTVIALNCHADLAADRPGAGQLTEFYFWLSFGGMLGGLFNTLAAPRLFTTVAEYPVAVLLGCLRIRPASAAAATARRAVLVPLAAGALTAASLILSKAYGLPLSFTLAALGVPAVLVFSQRRAGARFGWSVAAMLAAGVLFAPVSG